MVNFEFISVSLHVLRIAEPHVVYNEAEFVQKKAKQEKFPLSTS